MKLLLVVLLLAAPDKPKKLPRWKSGERTGTVEIDGKKEAFVALVPRGYSRKKPTAAVLLLHGNGGKAANFLRAIKPLAGKRPPLLISLERCDNNQKAIGYAPKYLEQLKKQFNIDVRTENEVLSISGEKSDQRTEGDEEHNYHVWERSYGSFRRSFSVPRAVDGAEATAHFDKGVLEVRLPKAPEAKGRKIEISQS